MSALWSTGLSNSVAVTGSMRAALNGGLLYIFSGPVPSSADAAVDPSSALLCTLSVGGAGTGLTFESTASNGVLAKTAAEAWSGTNAASGNASFWRFCAPADDGKVASATAARVQGSVGTDATADMILPNVMLQSGNTQAINVFNLY